MINISPTFHPKQGVALELLSNDSPVEVVGYGGAKGGGKSHLSRQWQICRRIKYPKSKGLLIRKTFPELDRTHIEKIKKELPKNVYRYNDQKHTFTFPNGSIQEMGYVDNEKDVDNYWGAEYDDIVIDEAQQHSKHVFQTLRTCLRTTRKEIRPKFLLTFNWGGIGFGWLKRTFWRKDEAHDTWANPVHWDENENPEQFAFVHAKVWDNPSIVDNDPGYIDRLKALPEQLRKAYLDGNPDVFEGQFFTTFGGHLKCKPFYIQRSDCEGRLIGSLDSGLVHATSYNQWWIGGTHPDYSIHLLFTYLNNGGTIRGHAKEIHDRIESFPFTYGSFPDTIYFDNEMNTAAKLSEGNVETALTMYKDVFRLASTRWVEANKDKTNGCMLMKTMFEGASGVPKFRYFDTYNTSFEEGIAAAITDKNRPEIYLKMDGDDACDSGRYGIIACMSEITSKLRSASIMMQSRKANRARQEMDWKSL